jgi:hypothetical protein
MAAHFAVAWRRHSTDSDVADGEVRGASGGVAMAPVAR